VAAGVRSSTLRKMCAPSLHQFQRGATPGLMVVTPNRVQTLVFSRADNRLTLISNGGESASAQTTLPGFTESIVISPDSQTAYIAVPTAPVVGHPPGAVEVLNLNTGGLPARLTCLRCVTSPSGTAEIACWHLATTWIRSQLFRLDG